MKVNGIMSGDYQKGAGRLAVSINLLFVYIGKTIN
jgi:hypothetical protein